MTHLNETGLIGWIRTTWLPYTEMLPTKKQDLFVKEIVHRYLKKHPADSVGIIHLDMMRLEIEAYKA
jgi:trans-aconitate 2-methyltransferase